jgi:hypothetical protein
MDRGRASNTRASGSGRGRHTGRWLPVQDTYRSVEDSMEHPTRPLPVPVFGRRDFPVSALYETRIEIAKPEPCRLTLSVIQMLNDQRVPLYRYTSPVRNWQVQEIFGDC